MLNGMITKNGLLQINRGGTMRQQYCPYHPAGLECGDWCPLFHEPYTMKEEGRKIVNLWLCNNRCFKLQKLIDERDDACSAGPTLVGTSQEVAG